MNSLSDIFTKYKHYFIMIVMLLITSYIVIPLSEWQAEQQQTLALVAKKSGKVNNLLENETQFTEQLTQLDSELAKMKSFVFINANEAQFKLKAQSSLERILTEADCNVERIGFKGNELISKQLSRWSIEIRFKGDAVCLTKTTRGLESMLPNIKIESFNINHRNLNQETKGTFTAVMNVSAWHFTAEQLQTKSSGVGQ